MHSYAHARRVVEHRLDDLWRGRVRAAYTIPGRALMAVLALGVAGAAIGGTLAAGTAFAATAASIGWAAGSFIGQMLFAPKQRAEGPRLKDLNITSSTDGAPIPIPYGTVRLPGNIIWATRPAISETQHEEDSGGKGGPSTTQVSYTYSANFAVGVRRGAAWRHHRLPPSVGGLQADLLDRRRRGPSDVRGEHRARRDALLRRHRDAAARPADPGARGRGQRARPSAATAYIVFENFQLADFANHIPNIEVELVSAGARTYPFHRHTSHAYAGYVGRDPDRGCVYYGKLVAGDFTEIHSWRGDATAPAVLATLSPPFPVAPDNKLCFNRDLREVVLWLGSATGMTFCRVSIDGYEIGRGNISAVGADPGNPAGISETVGIRGTPHWSSEHQKYFALGLGFSSGDQYVVEITLSTTTATTRTFWLSFTGGSASDMSRSPLVDSEGRMYLSEQPDDRAHRRHRCRLL